MPDVISRALQEMAALFRAPIPEPSPPTLEIAERARFRWETRAKNIRTKPVPAGQDAAAASPGSRLAQGGRRFPRAYRKVRALLVKELSLIAKLDYARIS